MALHEEIQLLHPGAKPGKDYTLRDDGNGPYIETWKLPGEKPDAAKIATKKSEADALREVKVAQMNREFKYPKVGDQLDAIGKVFKHLKANGTDIGPDGDALIDSLDEVKETYPVEKP